MRRLLCLGALLGLLPKADLSAQTAASAPAPADALLRAGFYSTMASDLRNLVIAQEVFFAEHATYAMTASEAFRNTSRMRVSPGVTLTLTFATETTYVARARHDALPKGSCILSIGVIPRAHVIRTDLERKRVREEGKPVCDTR